MQILLYNMNMKRDYTFLRVRPETAYSLRVLAALKDTTMIALLDRLVTEAVAEHYGIPPAQRQKSSDKVNLK